MTIPFDHYFSIFEHCLRHIFFKSAQNLKAFGIDGGSFSNGKKSVAVASHWPTCRDHQDNITSTIHTSTVHQGKLECCKNCIVFIKT